MEWNNGFWFVNVLVHSSGVGSWPIIIAINLLMKTKAKMCSSSSYSSINATQMEVGNTYLGDQEVLQVKLNQAIDLRGMLATFPSNLLLSTFPIHCMPLGFHYS
jgi:hypothetical protein